MANGLRWRLRPWFRRIEWRDEQGRRCVRFETKWWARLVPNAIERWWQRTYDDRIINKRPLTEAEKAHALELARRHGIGGQ